MCPKAIQDTFIIAVNIYRNYLQKFCYLFWNDPVKQLPLLVKDYGSNWHSMGELWVSVDNFSTRCVTDFDQQSEMIIFESILITFQLSGLSLKSNRHREIKLAKPRETLCSSGSFSFYLTWRTKVVPCVWIWLNMSNPERYYSKFSLQASSAGADSGREWRGKN